MNIFVIDAKGLSNGQIIYPNRIVTILRFSYFVPNAEQRRRTVLPSHGLLGRRPCGRRLRVLLQVKSRRIRSQGWYIFASH